MGKAKALRLGITKGVQHVAKAVLPQTYKCPVCKYVFKAYDVAVQSKETGESPEMIVAGHIKDCLAKTYPNRKSECLMCKEKGKTFKCTISELDAHIAECHPDSPDSNSDNTGSQASSPGDEKLPSDTIVASVPDSEQVTTHLSRGAIDEKPPSAMLTSVFSTGLATGEQSEKEKGAVE